MKCRSIEKAYLRRRQTFAAPLLAPLLPTRLKFACRLDTTEDVAADDAARILKVWKMSVSESCEAKTKSLGKTARMSVDYQRTRCERFVFTFSVLSA